MAEATAPVVAAFRVDRPVTVLVGDAASFVGQFRDLGLGVVTVVHG